MSSRFALPHQLVGFLVRIYASSAFSDASVKTPLSRPTDLSSGADIFSEKALQSSLTISSKKPTEESGTFSGTVTHLDSRATKSSISDSDIFSSKSESVASGDNKAKAPKSKALLDDVDDDIFSVKTQAVASLSGDAKKPTATLDDDDDDDIFADSILSRAPKPSSKPAAKSAKAKMVANIFDDDDEDDIFGSKSTSRNTSSKATPASQALRKPPDDDDVRRPCRLIFHVEFVSCDFCKCNKILIPGCCQKSAHKLSVILVIMEMSCIHF